MCQGHAATRLTLACLPGPARLCSSEVTPMPCRKTAVHPKNLVLGSLQADGKAPLLCGLASCWVGTSCVMACDAAHGQPTAGKLLSRAFALVQMAFTCRNAGELQAASCIADFGDAHLAGSRGLQT